MEHVLCICTTGTLLWYINRTITQHHPSSSVSPVDTHRHTYILDVLHIYVFTHAHACSPVDCDLPALTTELWLTGCYRSHLRPLTVCTVLLDICVYIKDGIEGRGDGGSGVSTECPRRGRGSAGGSGRHLIKAVAAHLRRFGFRFGGLKEAKCGRLWAWMDVCFSKDLYWATDGLSVCVWVWV